MLLFTLIFSSLVLFWVIFITFELKRLNDILESIGDDIHLLTPVKK